MIKEIKVRLDIFIKQLTGTLMKNFSDGNWLVW